MFDREEAAVAANAPLPRLWLLLKHTHTHHTHPHTQCESDGPHYKEERWSEWLTDYQNSLLQPKSHFQAWAGVY